MAVPVENDVHVQLSSLEIPISADQVEDGNGPFTCGLLQAAKKKHRISLFKEVILPIAAQVAALALVFFALDRVLSSKRWP